MSTIKEIDDNILTLRQEQAKLSTAYEQLMEQLNQLRVRYQQTVGGISALQILQKQISNGSEPPP